MKESDIPPIRGNPRIGKETSKDASVMYGGAKLSKRKGSRRSRQRNFTIKNEEQLRKLMEVLGISATAVVNLALSRLAKENL